MKKYMIFCLFSFAMVSCSLFEANDLAEMRDSFVRHIKAQDEANEMKKEIEMAHAISYQKLNDEEKVEPEDAYLTKIYLVSKSWYIGGSRVYNTNDTLEVYFNKDKRFLRVKK